MTVNWHTRFVIQSNWTSDLRKFLFDRVGLAYVQRVLEVGCGTGAVLMDTNFSTSNSLRNVDASKIQIHGLDINSDFLSQASHHAPFSHLTQGDGHRLPYATSTFQLVYCHFLLLWVHNPRLVLEEMVRVTSPEGSILALAEPDYGGRIDYPLDFIEVGEMQEAALRHQGAETRLGRHLRGLFQRCGLENIETGVLGGQWFRDQFTEEQQTELDVLKEDLKSQIPPEKIAHICSMELEARRNGERVLFVPTFYAWGQKPI